jgi:hypothetical protein
VPRPVRGPEGGGPADKSSIPPDPRSRSRIADTQMWHVTLTVGGPAVDPAAVRTGLERLAQERPFLLTARYAADRGEVRYWEEAREIDDAAALALRLWGEHRVSAGLPPWRVIGLEVVDRSTWQLRAGSGSGPRNGNPLTPAGQVLPF